MDELYCQYYQAQVVSQTAWFVVGYFKSEEHLVFERAFENTNTFEFFIPAAYEENFCLIMQSLQRAGYIESFIKMDNRIQQEHALAFKNIVE